MKPAFVRVTSGPHGGMVLIEVLVALTIFTLVAFSLVLALNAAMDVAKERNQVDTVMLGLENEMALLGKGRLVMGGRDLPDDGTGIAYHLTVAPEILQDQKKSPLTGIYRATLTANWKLDGQADDRTVSELIYQP